MWQVCQTMQFDITMYTCLPGLSRKTAFCRDPYTESHM